GDRFELVAVLDGDGEVHGGGAAEDAGGGVRVAVAEGCFLGWACGLDVSAAAEGDPDSGDGAGGVAGDRGDHAGGDADGSAVAELQGVPDVGDELADLAGYCGLEGCGNGNVFSSEVAHRFPDPGEFVQGGLAVEAVALVVGELACVPVGGLFEQLIGVGAAGKVADGAAEQLAAIAGRLAGIGHFPFTSTALASDLVCAFRGTGGYGR